MVYFPDAKSRGALGPTRERTVPLFTSLYHLTGMSDTTTNHTINPQPRARTSSIRSPWRVVNVGFIINHAS